MDKHKLANYGLLVVTTIAITLLFVGIANNYNVLSNEKLQNITRDAYIRGTLYVAETGKIPYLQNGTFKVTTVEQLCNLNTQEVQKSQQ